MFETLTWFKPASYTTFSGGHRPKLYKVWVFIEKMIQEGTIDSKDLLIKVTDNIDDAMKTHYSYIKIITVND